MSEWKKAIPVVGASTALLSVLLLRIVEAVGLMPAQAAVQAEIVDHAFHAMLLVTVPMFSLIVSVLAYIVFAFRETGGPAEGRKLYGSRGRVVEIGWVSLSAVLTLGLSAYGTEEFLALRGDGSAELTVQVKAAQWSWEFYYPEQDVVSTTLILPRGKTARILLGSEDVVHSFWVPEFRVKQDALPGRVVALYVKPTRKGSYELVCAELCGLDHSLMKGRVRVVDPDELDELLQGESW